jgi:3-isopropylmalate/(R)-2-methylmalate dehydratase small subunit
MEPIRTFQTKTIVLPIENVDTDQIIPARFLKVTSKIGIGANLFADWRYDAEGQPRPEFILNRPEAKDAAVLVAGENFGCGSSREHAAWALHDHGFRAIVSTSIADIFKSNSLKNGLLPIVVDRGVHAKLVAASGAVVTVSIEDQTVALADGSTIAFPIDPFARHCLMNGKDELGFLLAQKEAIARFEATPRSG